jgi:hypothetical protein
MVSAGQFVAYFDVAEDAFVPTEKEHRLPRTAAIATIGYHASKRLGLTWKIEAGKVVGRLGGKSVGEVSRVADEYSILICADRVPVTLHLAALHGIAVLLAAEKPKPRRRVK